MVEIDNILAMCSFFIQTTTSDVVSAEMTNNKKDNITKALYWKLVGYSGKTDELQL